MLRLDLTSLSESELEQVVAEHCSRFGCATVLKVFQTDDRSGHGIAAVSMSSEDEADDLARNFGGSRCGLDVVIGLAQRGRRIPTISTRNYFIASATESALSGTLH